MDIHTSCIRNSCCFLVKKKLMLGIDCVVRASIHFNFEERRWRRNMPSASPARYPTRTAHGDTNSWNQITINNTCCFGSPLLLLLLALWSLVLQEERGHPYSPGLFSKLADVNLVSKLFCVGMAPSSWLSERFRVPTFGAVRSCGMPPLSWL